MGRSREQRQARRKQPQRKTQVRMHGWDDADEADLSHECDVTPLCINRQHAECSELRVVSVRVRDGVLVVHRFVLKHVRIDVIFRSHFYVVICS